MGRLPSLVPAETPYAAWMRAYRAHRAGRGPDPGPRRVWEAQLADLATAERIANAERSWCELRDAVLDLGGIAPNADYGWESIPRPVYRRAGKPADLIALLLDENGSGFRFGCDAELMADLWKRSEDLRHAREDS